MRKAMRTLRLLLRLGRLLLPLVVLCIFTDSGRASASPEPEPTTTTTTSTLPPSPTWVGSFGDWTPCEDRPSLTTQEWAACSTAYNVDRLRQFVTVTLFVLSSVVVAGSLAVLLRR